MGMFKRSSWCCAVILLLIAGCGGGESSTSPGGTIHFSTHNNSVKNFVYDDNNRNGLPDILPFDPFMRGALNLSDLDATGDGYPDFLHYDTNGDGRVDLVYVQSSHPRVPSIQQLDEDADGLPERLLLNDASGSPARIFVAENSGGFEHPAYLSFDGDGNGLLDMMTLSLDSDGLPRFFANMAGEENISALKRGDRANYPPALAFLDALIVQDEGDTDLFERSVDEILFMARGMGYDLTAEELKRAFFAHMLLSAYGHLAGFTQYPSHAASLQKHRYAHGNSYYDSTLFLATWWLDSRDYSYYYKNYYTWINMMCALATSGASINSQAFKSKMALLIGSFVNPTGAASAIVLNSEFPDGVSVSCSSAPIAGMICIGQW